MTDGAQQALRRTMEIYSKTTRFALACNASDKIIGRQLWKHFIYPIMLCYDNVLCPFFSEPIQSRCAVLRYSKLSDAQILARLLEVCDKEKVYTIIVITRLDHMIHFTFDHSDIPGAQDWRWPGGDSVHGPGRHETSAQQSSVDFWWICLCQCKQCFQGII